LSGNSIKSSNIVAFYCAPEAFPLNSLYGEQTSCLYAYTSG